MKEKTLNIIVGFAILVLFIVLLFRTMKHRDMLSLNNKITLGFVIKTQVRGRSTPDIYYEFVVNNKKYEGFTKRDSYKDYRFRNGDTIIVKYYPPNPKINEAILNIKVKDLKAHYKGDDLIVK